MPFGGQRRALSPYVVRRALPPAQVRSLSESAQEAEKRYRRTLGMDDPRKTPQKAEEGPSRGPLSERARAIEYRLSVERQELALRTVPKKLLKPQQWAFVKAWVEADGTKTLTEVAQEVGISGTTASAWTNPIKSPHIVAAIQEHRKFQRDKYGVTLERHLRDLQKIRDAALNAGSYSAAVAAEHKRGLAVGNIYVDRKEIRHGSIDTMSREEVEKRLSELEAVYGKLPPSEIIDSETGEIIDQRVIDEARDYIRE